MNYKVIFADPTFSENTFDAYIDQCRTSDDIRELIERNLFTIERLDMPCGSLRKEHIEKAVKIALYFGTTGVLPDIPLLRKLCSKGIASPDKEMEIDHAQLVQYYKDTYPDLDLDDSQWDLIADKLTLEDFLSIDRMAERAVFIWNSIPGVHTTNSCTGHVDALRYFCFSNLNISYDHIKISQNELYSIFHEGFADFNNDIMMTDIQISDGSIGILYFQVPPKKWIVKHNTMQVKELAQKCYDQLVSTFNTGHDLDNFKQQMNVSSVHPADFIRRKLYTYFNNLNVTFEIDDNEDEYFWKIFRKRCLVFEETYKEYYLSQDAIRNIKKFWEYCKKAGMKIRSIIL